MKFKRLLFSVAVMLGLQSNAQTWVSDSVSMNAGYAKDIFYSLPNGTIDSVINNNWHLGFEMIPGGMGFGGVSVIANHVRGSVKVYSLHLQGSSFMTLAPSDTMTKTLLYNSDTSWDWGAMNVNSSGSLFDYGWGQYNSSDHHVYGDSLYMLNIAGTVYKLLITHYHSKPADSIYYAFHIAKFDGSNDYQDTVWRKPNYEKKNFAFFDVVNNTFINREPDNDKWDIIFTSNIEQVTGIPYPVTTVYSNIGVKVAEVQQLTPSASIYSSLTYLTDMHVIGSDWKHQPMGPGPWPLNDSANYFIKTKKGEYYQLHFKRFDGSATGVIVFEKRLVAFASAIAQTSNKMEAFAIVPNPAVNQANIMIDAKENGNAMIIVTDLTGKIVEKNNVKLNAGINAYAINTASYNTGTYLVTISNGNWKLTEKLAVQH